jgi:hypothetical protein
MSSYQTGGYSPGSGHADVYDTDGRVSSTWWKDIDYDYDGWVDEPKVATRQPKWQPKSKKLATQEGKHQSASGGTKE